VLRYPFVGKAEGTTTFCFCIYDMNIKLYKVRQDKLETWKQWCFKLSYLYNVEVLEILKEEKVTFEACGLMMLNNEYYVLGIIDKLTEQSINFDRDLILKHRKIRKECLEFVTTINMLYYFKK
jgi:hypothetical protein